jgi:hypothetical protein
MVFPNYLTLIKILLAVFEKTAVPPFGPPPLFFNQDVHIPRVPNCDDKYGKQKIRPAASEAYIQTDSQRDGAPKVAFSYSVTQQTCKSLRILRSFLVHDHITTSHYVKLVYGNLLRELGETCNTHGGR